MSDIPIRAQYMLTSTPGAFGQAARQFHENYQAAYGYGGPFITPTVPPTYPRGTEKDGPITMQLYMNTPGPNPHKPISAANATAQREDDGRVSLTVVSPDLDWPHIQPFWELFYADLVQRGLIEAPAKLTAKEVLDLFEERRKTERKLELKALCEELGVNYASIRVAKSRIEKEKRKRGPYKKKNVNS